MWNFINASVPQGSILGPYLFLLFVNGIVDVVSNNIKLFADDTSLYCIVDNHGIKVIHFHYMKMHRL